MTTKARPQHRELHALSTTILSSRNIHTYTLLSTPKKSFLASIDRSILRSKAEDVTERTKYVQYRGNSRHSKMGQRVRHSASCMLTKSCSHAVFNVTMKICLTSIIFVGLVCCVGANFPCKPEQIHWNTTVGKRPKCFDCPDCPPGTEPSIPCGTSVYEWPEIHCVLCKLGKTYSDKDDTSHCKACTICSIGKAVKSNCTLTANTECDNKCGPGFYTVPLISGCFPCTPCCGDGKDEFAAECANNNKKCKVRYTPCTRFQTTPSKLTERTYSTSNTAPTVQKAGERTTMDVNEEEESLSGELSISISPTSALDNEMSEDEIVESGKQDAISIVVILLIITVALCVVLSMPIIMKRVMLVVNMSRSSREQDSNNEGCDISQGGTPPLPHSSARSSQDSSTPLLNPSESPQQNGFASSQHMSFNPVQTNGAVSSQPNEFESPEPDRSNSLHSSVSVSTQPDGFASTHSSQLAAAARSSRSAQEQVRSNPGDVTLEELEEKHFPVFERMCKDLNSRRPGERWDFERLASCYDKISLTDRNSLKNEFQNDRGNPSDVLMSHIKTKYPDHTVRHLGGNLQSIGRDDIAQRLMPYTLRKPSFTQGY